MSFQQTVNCIQETTAEEDEEEDHFTILLRTPFDAEEFLVNARQRARKLLVLQNDASSVVIHDLPYLLRATRALIAMNKSIWDRCQENRSETTADGVLPFSRVSIVQIRTRVDNSQTTFQVHMAVTSKDFGVPPPVPQELAALLAVPLPLSSTKNSGCDLPDYAAYLDHATLLRDEVLVPFLVKLKDHLESIHVFLGTIESWILEPLGHSQFLHEVFDGVSQFEIPKLQDLLVPCGDNGGDLKCCSARHPHSSPCLRCRRPYRSHQWGLSRNGVMTHLCDYHSRSVGSFLKTVDRLLQFVYCQPCAGTGDADDDVPLDEIFSLDSHDDKVQLVPIMLGPV